MNTLHDVITDYSVLEAGYLSREGYIFSSGQKANIYDAIVIRSPFACNGPGFRRWPISGHSLEEHIEFINKHQLEYAWIIAEDLSFITRCPSLKYLNISPAKTAADGFDYSPLYQMPEINSLNATCVQYGPHMERKTSIDLSKIQGLREVKVMSKGHLHYDRVKTLEVLELFENKCHRDLRHISCSPLKELTLTQCSVRTLAGIEVFDGIQSLHLYYLRSLEDISELKNVGKSLRALTIQNCPKVKDFGCLYDLPNLEHLNLEGKNILPNLKFLNNMKKLKTFVFSMEIADRDIRPCLDIHCVHMSGRKRDYNLTDKNLPKGKLTEPFKLL